jgi:glutamate formiminotransferase/formiminotetrahydrofolate cyclodeaminase
MGKFVECVPNFSEGRDLSKINAIVDAARAVPGVLVLDVEKDADHNRTVLTFIAPVETAADAMFAVTKKASELIDLNQHKGEHPRMGATDVAPFIPVMDSTIEDCVALAARAGERIGRELGIPVYLYDKAARVDHRRDLAKVRKGQFEGLREVIGKDPERVPDFGPNKIHPTAGAMAVGARHQIVNFNVNLATTDMEFSKVLAKKIRTTGGGLPALRAKEIFLESKGQVQMSTVLTDYKTTSIKRVLDEMNKDLGPKGIEITGTELIGLTTQEALTDYAVESLKVQGFDKNTQVLETKLLKLLGSWQSGAGLLADALANTDPTPGGGSAAAIAGAMGCALGQMAAGITLRGKKLEESKKPGLTALHSRLGQLRGDLQACVAEDSASFDAFMAAMKTPKDNPERKSRMQAALKYAAEVPLRTARLAAGAAAELRKCGDVSSHVVSDYRSALYLLEAAVKGATENVFINAESLDDKELAARMVSDARSFIDGVSAVKA